MSTTLAYLVRWQRDFCYRRTDWKGSERLPGQRLMKLFLDESEAYDYLDRLQQGRIASPPEANPFLSLGEGGDLDSLMDMPEPVFLDLLRDLGLEPPVEQEIKPRHGKPFVGRDWYGWYRETAPTMDEIQRCRIWQTFDFLSFYEVVEIEVDAALMSE